MESNIFIRAVAVMDWSTEYVERLVFIDFGTGFSKEYRSQLKDRFRLEPYQQVYHQPDGNYL